MRPEAVKQFTAKKIPIMKGRISEREDRDIEIVCSQVESFPENAQKSVLTKKMAKGLYLKVKNTDDETFEKIKKILAEHSGSTAVYIYCTSTGKKLEAPKSLQITPEERLFENLFAVLGEENVKMVK